MYHHAMRAFFIILLIALLPLRGWVGSAMATEMASVQVSIAMPVDCAEHATSSQKEKSHGGSCASCQFCHTVALAAPARNVLAVHMPFAWPASMAAAFSSAALAPSQKPPSA